MAVFRFDEMTWAELGDLDRSRAVPILPIGATEAHGPHLPLNTDVVIAQAMARDGAERLSRAGLEALVLPPLVYTSASFAAGFPGTVSMAPPTVASTITEIARGLAGHGFARIALANAHFDPVHVRCIRAAIDVLESDAVPLQVVFPDITRKPWVLRLSEEFRSGACHAGQYEGSIVMAERPDLVRDDIREQLADNPVSLSDAIRAGKTSFESAGGPSAYFGYPAKASAREGRQTVSTLGEILHDAVLQAIGAPKYSDPERREE